MNTVPAKIKDDTASFDTVTQDFNLICIEIQCFAARTSHLGSLNPANRQIWLQC